MNKSISFLFGGLLLATFAMVNLSAAEAPLLARKTGGSSERLLQKQQERHKGASQNQPTPEPRLARKVGAPESRLLWQVRRRARA